MLPLFEISPLKEINYQELTREFNGWFIFFTERKNLLNNVKTEIDIDGHKKITYMTTPDELTVLKNSVNQLVEYMVNLLKHQEANSSIVKEMTLACSNVAPFVGLTETSLPHFLTCIELLNMTNKKEVVEWLRDCFLGTQSFQAESSELSLTQLEEKLSPYFLKLVNPEFIFQTFLSSKKVFENRALSIENWINTLPPTVKKDVVKQILTQTPNNVAPFMLKHSPDLFQQWVSEVFVSGVSSTTTVAINQNFVSEKIALQRNDAVAHPPESDSLVGRFNQMWKSVRGSSAPKQASAEKSEEVVCELGRSDLKQSLL